MNLKNLFLVVSFCTFSSIHCSSSDEKVQKESTKQPKSDQKRLKIDTISTSQKDSAQGESESGKIQAVPSTIFTTMWYGATKHVAKQTALGIFKELHKNGTLQADYQSNMTEAFNRLNAAAAERFTQRDLSLCQQQAKIAELFATATTINQEFALAKALANKYYILQKKALDDTLTVQATQTEPKLREKRDIIIKQAEDDYITQLSNELIHAKDAASNSRYLHRRSEIQESFPHQNETHYKNIEAFSQLLNTINPEVEIANNTNLYHLPRQSYESKKPVLLATSNAVGAK